MPQDTIPKAAFDLAVANAAEWKALFYWAVGGLAIAIGSMAMFIKGFLTLRAEEQKENAKSEVLQAETNRTVAEALKGLTEAIYGRKG